MTTVSFDWMVVELGASRTFELTTRFAYTGLYIPKNGARSNSNFVRALRVEELLKLQARWAGQTVRLPIARRFRCLYLHRVRGKSPREIATELKIADASVRAMIRRGGFDEIVTDNATTEVGL